MTVFDSIHRRGFCNAEKPGGFERTPPSEVYERMEVEDMPTRRLRHALCSLGPAKCAECGMCAYGREYVRRVEHGR